MEREKWHINPRKIGVPIRGKTLKLQRSSVTSDKFFPSSENSVHDSHTRAMAARAMADYIEVSIARASIQQVLIPI